MSGYSPVTVSDNWGHLTYHDDYGPLDLRAGKQISVLWPDGEQTVETIAETSQNAHINDMGHEYSVTQYGYGFDVDYRGVTLWVPLEKVRIYR